ncbi:hypothetical protein HG531_002967 [Fusarium graminearum]|nr:hypothetical protein HG531_002967 [Fusarium graminearum]
MLLRKPVMVTRMITKSKHQVATEPASPAHGSQGLNGVKDDENANAAGSCLHDSLLLGTDLPQSQKWHGCSSDDLTSEAVENHNDRRPRVPDGEEGDKGAVPLDARQNGLVAGLEVVKVSKDGEHHRTNRACLELVEIKKLS